MTVDLISLVLTVRPAEAATRPAYLGRAVHAAFLRWLAERDPQRADALHAADQRRPFTCSSLFGAKPQRGSIELSPERTYWLRLTGLEAGTSSLLAALATDPPPTLELDGVTFAVEGATADPGEHGWAGQTSYQDLAAAHLLGAERPRSRWELELASPTTFRSGGMNVPLPLPGLVVGSLLARWNAFAPLALPDEVRRFTAECVAIARYSLRTEAIPLKPGALQVGCVGRVGYVALNKDRYWLSIMHLLAAYAQYAGIGYQTTVGLGQARLAGRKA